MNTARRFVLVDSTAPHNPNPSARRRCAWLQPIAWGKPDPRLARSLAADVRDVTPRFQFNGVRAALRSIFD